MAITVSILLAFCHVALASIHPPYSYHSQPSYTPQPVYCDPTIPPKCAYNGTTFCLQDSEYPAYEIKAAISADYLFAKKYSDVADQSADDLIDHVTQDDERLINYGYYTGASTGHSPFDLSHWAGPKGYICPSHITYAMPKRAQNVEGVWRVIVNDVHYYTQTTRLESCIYPDSACRALAPCYQSHCTQKYIYHRMLSYDPCDPYKGLFIDIFKFPAACSCHVDTY